MLFKKKKDKETVRELLDYELLHSLEALEDLDPKSDGYERVIDNAKKIHDMQDNTNRLNVNTVVSVGGSILVCVLAIGFEKFGNGIFPWKMSGFMPKK